MLKSYFKALVEVASRGDAREESFYSSLESLLRQFAAANGHPHAHVTTLPKKTEAGNPDFRVWDGQHRIIGYIEAKRPTEENLDAVEDSEQLQRYLSTFPNLILTNFCEFRLYRNGERIGRVLAARPYVLNRLGQAPPVEKEEELHLLRSPELDLPAARFYGVGDNRVAKNARQGFRYEPEAERVWINENQYFAPVPPEVWEYVIGGYQVLEKWLKDRRERRLSLAEIQTYCRIVTALGKTLEIQEEIDALYGRVEEAVVTFGA